MKWILAVVVMVVVSPALALALTSSSRMPKSRWVTEDFFISRVSSAQPRLNQFVDDDCRARIKTVMCLVDPLPENQNPKQKPEQSPALRPCLPGGEDYAGAFEAIYDQYPESLQKMFCSLERIFVEKEFVGTAYAGLFVDEQGAKHGAVIGVRKSILETPMSLEFWASWKEQLSFGGIYDHYELTPGLPFVEAKTSSTNEFLYFVLAHEFGHIFDFANSVNQFSCPNPTSGDDENCLSMDGSWSSLSWRTSGQTNPESDFTNRSKLCFYWCADHPLSPELQDETYVGWLGTNFISLYSSSNPYDDFAESLAYLAIHDHLQPSYVIRSGTGSLFDVVAKFESDTFAAKRTYVEQFLQRADLIYP